jgi:hypothetical protein
MEHEEELPTMGPRRKEEATCERESNKEADCH